MVAEAPLKEIHNPNHQITLNQRYPPMLALGNKNNNNNNQSNPYHNKM